MTARPRVALRAKAVQARRSVVVRAAEAAEEPKKGMVSKIIDAVKGDAKEEAPAKAEAPKAEAKAEEPKATEDKPAIEYYNTADPRLSGQQVKDVLGLFDKWNASLASGKPENVADCYASDGVLLPTVSNTVRSTREGLVSYFTNFLKLSPQGVIDEYGIRLEATDADGNASVISNSGIYTFTFGLDGRKVQARFTYVYKKEGDDWKILSHHSSQLPTQLAPTPFEGDKWIGGNTTDEGLTKEEEAGVLGAFSKWNSALATLNPENVVDCYAEDAVLLPTVADDLRTTKDERREYFVNFLQNKPQGELDEYHIRLIGRDGLGLPSAVSNQGIYTFEMGASGDKVQARYTFNYERVGNEWLIKKHHSSAMPEMKK